LKDNNFRSESLAHGFHDVFVDLNELVILETIQKRYVDCIAGSFLTPHILDISCPREEVTISVEADGHHSVGCVKGFFNSIAVVDVDIDVEHSLMILEQLQDSKHNVIYITEPRGRLLLCMMKASSPVDANVRRLMIQLDCSINRPSTRNLTKLEKSREARAVIFTNIKFLGFFDSMASGLFCCEKVWGNSFEVIDILIGVKVHHLLVCSLVWLVHMHFPVEFVLDYKLVSHLDPEWLHWMVFSIVKASDVG